MHKAFVISEDAIEHCIDICEKLKVSTHEREQLNTEFLFSVLEENDYNGAMLADVIWDTWFPENTANVFISHSHRDESAAMYLAEYLRIGYGLNSFIDSTVWAHADELQRLIDNKYCRNPISRTYSYEMRNRTTAHVHTLLGAALTRMIDKTECFMFIDTENSTSMRHLKKETFSPWIFHELSIANIIATRPTGREQRQKMFSEGFRKKAGGQAAQELKVRYPIALGRFGEISKPMIQTWELAHNSKEHPLDSLYGCF